MSFFFLGRLHDMICPLIGSVLKKYLIHICCIIDGIQNSWSSWTNQWISSTALKYALPKETRLVLKSTISWRGTDNKDDPGIQNWNTIMREQRMRYMREWSLIVKFLHKMATGGHFGWLKITFDLISRHYISTRNFFYFFHKMVASGHFSWSAYDLLDTLFRTWLKCSPHCSSSSMYIPRNSLFVSYDLSNAVKKCSYGYFWEKKNDNICFWSIQWELVDTKLIRLSAHKDLGKSLV